MGRYMSGMEIEKNASPTFERIPRGKLMSPRAAWLCFFSQTNFVDSISSLEFNPTGTKLAIASSYTFEEGQKEYVT